MTEPLLLLSRTDCEIIAKSERLARQCSRHGLDPEDLVQSFLTLLAFADSDIAVRQAAARLPKIVHAVLKTQVTELLGTEHPGFLFVFKPHEPTDRELEILDAGVRKTVELLLRFIETPEPAVPVTCEEVNLRADFIAQCETVPDAICRMAGCCRPPVTHGVFCPEHHFEMLQQLGVGSEGEKT